MDSESVKGLLGDLATHLDSLESSLAPVLSAPLSTSTAKLPLLDKAKLYVLATYAVETALFNFLRINGVDAKTHPVFQELTRVKSYFAKIQQAENPAQPRARLDKAVAGRFIRHDLAGNPEVAQARSGAKVKLEEMSTGTHTRFDGAAKRKRGDESLQTVNVVRVDDLDSSEEDEERDDESGGPEPQSRQRGRKAEKSIGKNKKARRAKKGKKHQSVDAAVSSGAANGG